MNYRKKLWLLILILGFCVPLSYVYCGMNNPGIMEPLWGTMPEQIRVIYPLFMILATLGFFPFTIYILWKIPEKNIRNFIIPYGMVLLFSALWMPLCVLWLNDQSIYIWILIRSVLLLVAIGSLWIGKNLLREKEHTLFRKFALLGIFFFCIQTVLLDAFVWPVFM